MRAHNLPQMLRACSAPDVERISCWPTRLSHMLALPPVRRMCLLADPHPREQPNEPSADHTDTDDRRVRLGDDCIRQAQQETNEHSDGHVGQGMSTRGTRSPIAS